eukprot:SAG11_NODE_6127_length_1383_cov_1.566978_3_plen_60_part_00
MHVLLQLARTILFILAVPGALVSYYTSQYETWRNRRLNTGRLQRRHLANAQRFLLRASL